MMRRWSGSMRVGTLMLGGLLGWLPRLQKQEP
ncbi:MAG: hypothetical protein OJF50_006428 [Nitrospira sp.]|nr:hypothetical protein [Nitrospira sp.]